MVWGMISLRLNIKPAPNVPKASRAKLEAGSGTATATVARLRVLIATARLGREVLKTSREMLGVSLLTPRKRAELSSANEEVPGAENVPSKLLALSKAEINAVNSGVSSTAI